MAAPPLPPWLSNPSGTNGPSPLLTLALSPSAAARSPLDKGGDASLPGELADCCRELEQGHNSWAAHRKEAAWRLRRVELQVEAERARRRREKAEEVEAKVRALREEQAAAMERIDAEYKERLLVLRRDAEAKEQKLGEQWAAKHARLGRLLEQLCSRRR